MVVRLWLRIGSLPITFEINPEGHYVEAHWVGRLSRQQAFDCHEAFFRSGFWRPLWLEADPVWVELANLSRFDAAEYDARWLSEEPAFFQRMYRESGIAAARVAIWAPDDLAFGASRVYEQTVAGAVPEIIRVFREREAALGWLLNPGRNGAAS